MPLATFYMLLSGASAGARRWLKRAGVASHNLGMAERQRNIACSDARRIISTLRLLLLAALRLLLAPVAPGAAAAACGGAVYGEAMSGSGRGEQGEGGGAGGGGSGSESESWRRSISRLNRVSC